MSKLYTPLSRLDLLFAAYYSVLLKDSSFRSDLEKLLKQLDQDLDPIVSKLKEKRYGLTAGLRERIIWGTSISAMGDPTPRAGMNPAIFTDDLETDTVITSCGNAALTLKTFVVNWKLPLDSTKDLYRYYSQARLQQADKAVWERELRRGYDLYGDWIVIPDFYYDPTRHGVKWLDQQIKEISQEIKRRAREIENCAREKGLRPMPTRWRLKGESEEGRAPTVKADLLSADLLQTAKVYYLREVRKQTWNQIARVCKCKGSRAAERHQNFVQAINRVVEDYLVRFSK